jgi:hypothetical protein
MIDEYPVENVRRPSMTTREALGDDLPAEDQT